MKVYKKIITICFILSLFLIFFILTKKYHKNIAEKLDLQRYIPDRLYNIGKFFYNLEISIKRINNDYNVKFLEDTQFIKLDFKKIKILNEINSIGYNDNLKKNNIKSFYLENYKDKIIIVSFSGKIFYKNISDLYDDKKKLTYIENNLKYIKTLDVYIKDKFIYISGIEEKDSCKTLVVNRGFFNEKFIIFKKIFTSKVCSEEIVSGKIKGIKINNEDFILLSTAADILKNQNEIDSKPQNNNSVFGKILKINLKNNKYTIYSRGHRNILGLIIKENIILSTENGPKGGDEINKIVEGGNYGWPISSYGERYKYNDEKPFYKKSHNNLKFIEPIFAFIPSLGISEIISLNNNFSQHWQDNYLIGTLNYRHLLRVRFDKDYNKIVYLENIYIGERIRDLLYLNQQKLILLSLENTGSIGIIKLKH